MIETEGALTYPTGFRSWLGEAEVGEAVVYGRIPKGLSGIRPWDMAEVARRAYEAGLVELFQRRSVTGGFDCLAVRVLPVTAKRLREQAVLTEKL